MADNEIIKKYLYVIETKVDTKSLESSLNKITVVYDNFFKNLDDILAGRSMELVLPKTRANGSGRLSDEEKKKREEEKARKKQEKLASKSQETEADRIRSYMKLFDKLDKEELAKQKKLDKENEKKKKTIEGYLKGFASGGGKGLLTKAGYVGIAVGIGMQVVQVLKAGFDMLENKAEQLSNSLIGPNSAFVDKNIRDYMIRYGVSSGTALGMQSVMNALGLDSSDMMKLTPGQANAYKELMQFYFDTFNELDKNKLNDINKSMQEYQLAMAKLDIKKQLLWQKFLVNNSERLGELFDAVSTFMGNLLDTLDALANSVFVKAFIDTITDLFELSNKSFEAVQRLTTGIGGYTTNVTNNINANFQTQVDGGNTEEVKSVLDNNNKTMISYFQTGMK